jgi:hypothetical protein
MLLALHLCGCQQELSELREPVSLEYREYFIKAGAHYCDLTSHVSFEANELRFNVKFDSSAFYTSMLPRNQDDINKLYGFADNNQHHHLYSARFGWRYSRGILSLHAYVYNNGERKQQHIAAIEPGREYSCSVEVNADKYIFRLNSVVVDMPRMATTRKGYKLFPYFGGDEVAPHDIRIWIKDKNQ